MQPYHRQSSGRFPDQRASASHRTSPRLPSHQLARELALFSATTLHDLEAVALQNRFDTKYLLAAEQVREMLPTLTRDYRVLEIDGRRQHQYRTRYFDTSDFALYRRHHANAPVRHKVRSRQYVESGLSFFEIKARDADGRVMKTRQRTASPLLGLGPAERALLAAAVPTDSCAVEPTLSNDFCRITLAGRRTTERVTLDLGIQFAYDGRAAILPGVAIIEVKQGGADADSAVRRLMAERGISATSISKYCLGVAMLVPGIERVAFEPKLAAIEALRRGITASWPPSDDASRRVRNRQHH